MVPVTVTLKIAPKEGTVPKIKPVTGLIVVPRGSPVAENVKGCPQGEVKKTETSYEYGSPTRPVSFKLGIVTDVGAGQVKVIVNV